MGAQAGASGQSGYDAKADELTSAAGASSAALDVQGGRDRDGTRLRTPI